MKKNKKPQSLIIVFLLLVGLVTGYLIRTIQSKNLTTLQFNPDEVYKILVEMKKSEEKRCGGPCTHSVNYIRAMNSKHAVVESKGIDGPGAYYIYENNDSFWKELRSGQDLPDKEWLKNNSIPILWFY